MKDSSWKEYNTDWRINHSGLDAFRFHRCCWADGEERLAKIDGVTSLGNQALSVDIIYDEDVVLGKNSAGFSG